MRLVLTFVFLSLLIDARPSAAYSVLAHEATVDSAWDSHVVPLLRARFPRLTSEQIVAARAYAYGGSLIQDLGYYPFGSKLFTNLAHYVRSGDFIEALIRDARDVNEYAFALGALAHYMSDNAGHPIAVNRAVPMMYPKVRRKIGDEALYVDSPARHLMVEFAFDVSQVARGAYIAQAYRDRIGFEVSKPLLERAVYETYAIELGDMFFDTDLAIGTYRRAIGTTIPEMTRIAWREKRDEIEKTTPGTDANTFVFAFSGQDYDREFGTKYRKPGPLARVLALFIKVLPKIGPLRAFAFEPLTPEAEQLFLESMKTTQDRYRIALEALRAGRMNLANTDFDTGRVPRPGRNVLADETYVELLDKLADKQFANVPPQLRRTLDAYFSNTSLASQRSKKRQRQIEAHLAALNARRPS